MGFSDWYHLDFKLIRKATERAFEVITADNKIYSLPRSLVADPDDYKAGDKNGVISIPERLAVEKGIIDAASD